MEEYPQVAVEGKLLTIHAGNSDAVTLFLAIVRRWLELPRGSQEAKALSRILDQLAAGFGKVGWRGGLSHFLTPS